MKRKVYRGKWIYGASGFEEGRGIIVEGGKIAAIRELQDLSEEDGEVVDLGDAAILPGQINVHSHAFQRALRGKTEFVAPGREGENFWTWRRGMYALANRIEPEEMEIIARAAYWEMARAGITEVGEFHYVHHDREGKAYERREELGLRMMKAAEDVGIRVTLLPVAYQSGDIGSAAAREQRRFLHRDLEAYFELVEALDEAGEGRTLVKVGMAPHSIRAVSREWMEGIGEKARAKEWVVHIHVCEQRKEVARSREVYGMGPVEALYEWGVLGEKWTLVHGTHLSERELEILGEVRPTVGACPTTERNLGDGFLPARELVMRGVPIGLGSDSHTVIDPFEEMRLVEYHERLRREERNVLALATGGAEGETAKVLFEMGTVDGARSLGSEGGRLEAGAPADFIALDLKAPSILGATRESLLTDVVLSMSAGAVQDVIVSGEEVIRGGRHGKEDEILREYRGLMERYARDA